LRFEVSKIDCLHFFERRLFLKIADFLGL